MVEVECCICGKKEFVSYSRSKRYKTCSRKCSSVLKTSIKLPNSKCKQCGVFFYKKPSHILKTGNFCSVTCMSKYQEESFICDGNPNFKNRKTDNDGYIICDVPNVGRMKKHVFITFKILNITKIPNGYHIHHRDCDITNNIPNNLVLISISDHKWLHSQFGSAGLWGYYNNKINKSLLLECCNDADRANNLLDLNINKQVGLFI
jgi:hypothetical protein